MISSQQISIDYSTAIARANTLRQAAGQCSANRAVIQAQINAVTAGLEGTAGTALLEKLNAWKVENDALESALLSAATSLANAAEAIKAADLAAAQAAAARQSANNSSQSSSTKTVTGHSLGGNIIGLFK